MLNMLNYIIKYLKLTANTRPMIFAYYTTVRLSKQRKEKGRNHLLIIVIHCLPETPVMLEIQSTGAPNDCFSVMFEGETSLGVYGDGGGSYMLEDLRRMFTNAVALQTRLWSLTIIQYRVARNFAGSNFFAIFAFFQRSIMFVLKPCNLKRRQNVLEDSLDSWYSQKLIIKNLRSRNGSFIKGKVV